MIALLPIVGIGLWVWLFTSEHKRLHKLKVEHNRYVARQKHPLN